MEKQSDKYHLRTVNIPLTLTADQLTNIANTIKEYSDHFNTYAHWLTANETTSKKKAHTAMYANLATIHPNFPTGLNQTARDQVVESIKSYNSRWPNKKYGKTPKFSAKSYRVDARTISLKGNGTLTFSTVGKRVNTTIAIPKWFSDRYSDYEFAKWGSIGINRNGIPFVNLVFRKLKASEVKPQGKRIVGVDRGIHYIVATSDGVGYSGKKIRGNKRKHLHNRKSLQEKGTKSARRRSRRMGQKESRFTKHVNHIVSKELAYSPMISHYILEDLSGYGKKQQQKLSKKAKSLKHSNKRSSDWAHSQLLEFLSYKCEVTGIAIDFVEAAYTSVTCYRCGFVGKSNRIKGMFHCSECGFRIQSDLNAALNIRAKWLLSHPEIEGEQVDCEPTVMSCKSRRESKLSAGLTISSLRGC